MSITVGKPQPGCHVCSGRPLRGKSNYTAGSFVCLCRYDAVNGAPLPDELANYSVDELRTELYRRRRIEELEEGVENYMVSVNKLREELAQLTSVVRTRP